MPGSWLANKLNPKPLQERAAEMAEMVERCSKVGLHTDLDHYTTWWDSQYRDWLAEILRNYAAGKIK